MSLVGIIICAVAPNVGTMIAGCTVYGLGEVVQLTFSVALGELVPNKYRPAVASLIFLTNAPFASFGPVIGMQSTSIGWVSTNTKQHESLFLQGSVGGGSSISISLLVVWEPFSSSSFTFPPSSTNSIRGTPKSSCSKNSTVCYQHCPTSHR